MFLLLKLSFTAGCCSVELAAEMAAVSPGFGVNEICWGDDWVGGRPGDGPL